MTNILLYLTSLKMHESNLSDPFKNTKESGALKPRLPRKFRNTIKCNVAPFTDLFKNTTEEFCLKPSASELQKHCNDQLFSKLCCKMRLWHCFEKWMFLGFDIMAADNKNHNKTSKLSVLTWVDWTTKENTLHNVEFCLVSEFKAKWSLH